MSFYRGQKTIGKYFLQRLFQSRLWDGVVSLRAMERTPDAQSRERLIAGCFAALYGKQK